MYAPPHLPTSLTDAPSTTVPPEAGPAPAATASGSRASAGGSASPSGESGAERGPSALAPAAAGSYSYDTAGASTFAGTTLPFPAVSTLAVDSPSGSRQHWTRDLRDASGNGPVTEYALDFRPEGIVLEGLTLTNSFSGMVNTQELRPSTAALFLPTGAGPGAHSEFDLATGDGRSAHASVEVTGSESVPVGDQAADSLVIRTTVTLPSGNVSGQVALTGWFAPSARIWVKEQFVADAVAGGGLFRFHSEYTATARGLTPA